MKRIALYTSGSLNGVKETGGVKRFRELLHSLPNWCELTLISADEKYMCPDDVKHIKTNVKCSKGNELYRWLNNLRAIHKMKQEKFDKVIVFDVPPAIGLVLCRVPHICLLIRKDLIGYQRLTLIHQNKPAFFCWGILNAMKMCEAFCLQYAEKVVVQCEYDKNELLSRHPIMRNRIKDKIDVQINNVNPSWITGMANNVVGREKLDEWFVIGCVSSFTGTRKGASLFLEAISKLIDQGVNVKARIAGDGSLLDAYRKQYAGYQGIEFLGRTSNPVEMISKCDLAVVPSYADSCPNTVMEALYVATPVIAANIGGIPEILQNSNALFDTNADKLKDKILDLITAYDFSGLREQQSKRKDELSFNWSEKIYYLIVR